MKTTISSIVLVACILSIAGCSSTKIDSGPISARTFNFIKPGKPASEIADKQQQAHELIQAAITQSLARRNVTRVDQGGDVIVAYLIITGNNVTTTSINDYFGYGRDADELLNKAHEKYTSGKTPYYFEAGTLLIDIIDAKSLKVLKRGYTTRDLLKDATPEVRAGRVNEAVEAILADVRFEP
jgi:hypothetical protein